MEFIPFNRTAKLSAIYTVEGQRCQNVHHYWFENTITVTDLEELCAFYVSWWDTYMKVQMPVGISLVKVEAVDLSEENGIGVEYQTGLPLSGNDADTIMPNNVTVAVKWLTGRTGRSYRGRTYHLGLRNGQVVGNTIVPVHLTWLLNSYTELVVANLTSNDAGMVVASRYENKTPRTTGLVTLVTNVSVDPTIDSQRRRLPGRGA